MTSQIVVHIDSELKEKAMQMAKKEGLTLKALLSFLLKGYTEQEIILTSRPRSVIADFEVEELSDDEVLILSQSSEIQALHKKLEHLWM